MLETFTSDETEAEPFRLAYCLAREIGRNMRLLRASRANLTG